MKKLTMAEYMALPREERAFLRRAAFGDSRVPAELTQDFDLEHLHEMLVRENERDAWMPERWTGQSEQDEEAYYSGRV